MPKTVIDKLMEGRCYRAIPAGRITTRAAEDGEKIVEGYASTFNEPYKLYSFENWTVREQIAPGAFDECDMSDVIMQYNHEGRVFARNTNDTLEVLPDEIGLFTRANLGGTQLGAQVYEEIAGGYTTKMSFGFRIGETQRTETRNEDTGEVDILITITKVSKLYDVSAVSLPANEGTSIEAVSARDYGKGVLDGIIEEIKKREAHKAKIRILTEVSV